MISDILIGFFYHLFRICHCFIKNLYEKDVNSV